jgi:hypothetical protein
VLPLVGGPAAPLLAELVEVPGEKWIFAEGIGPFQRGDDVISLLGSVGIADRGVVPIGGGRVGLIRRLPLTAVGEFTQDDLRVLPVKFDAQNERRRNFSEAVQLMNDEEPEGGMVLLKPPRTVMWSLKDMGTNGGDPRLHFEWWLRNSKLPDGDRSSYEMEVLCMAVYAMVVIDQLNAPSLTCAEVMMRRIAVIKEAHRLSPSSPDYSASDYFMGWGMRRSGATIDPALTSSVADQMRADAAVAKEARKAREERVLKSAKGRGKGKADKAGSSSAHDAG